MCSGGKEVSADDGIERHAERCRIDESQGEYAEKSERGQRPENRARKTFVDGTQSLQLSDSKCCAKVSPQLCSVDNPRRLLHIPTQGEPNFALKSGAAVCEAKPS